MAKTQDEIRAAARARYHRRKAEDPERVAEQSRRSSRAYARKHRRDPQVMERERRRQRALRAAMTPEQRAADTRRANRRRQARRLRVAAAPPLPIDLDYERIIRADPCSYCGGPGEQTDHIVPLAAGGDNHWPNLTSACGSCNPSKGTRPLLVFLLGGGGRTT